MSSTPTLWKVAPNGKPLRKGSIIADADPHLWGWSAALFGWCSQGRPATAEEIHSAVRGLDYLARRMAESVRHVSDQHCDVTHA